MSGILLEGLDANSPLISLEKVTDKEIAFKRLDHNSYDVLVLQDGFVKNILELPIMAYAMTRPSIIVCKGFFRLLYFCFWHYFSKFSRKFKLSKKLINFAVEDDDNVYKNYLKQLVVYLSKNHLNLYEKVNAEITENTLKNI